MRELIENWKRLQRRALEYDERGDLVTHRRTADGEALALEYCYDLANNLIRETYPSGILLHLGLSYDYDPVHNRTLLQQDSDTTTYGYATDSNRLIDINGGTIGVDEAVNRISQGYKTLSYDSNSRLSEVKTSGAPLGRYQYDALGQRRKISSVPVRKPATSK